MASARGFGVDVGGSGIKGAPVDLGAGTLGEDRVRIPTPQPASPDAVAGVVGDVVAHYGWTGPLGVTLPCVVKQGIALTAANVDPAWRGTDAAELLRRRTGCPVVVLNDADAAGLAEMRFGAGRGRDGVVVLLTFGTGIGSAVFHHGELMPNTELGHIEVDGYDGETRAAASVREKEDLSWEEWAARVSRYLQALERLLWPDLVIAGGGVSKRADRWLPLVECRTEVVVAALQNNAGIVGAATAAAEGRVL